MKARPTTWILCLFLMVLGLVPVIAQEVIVDNTSASETAKFEQVPPNTWVVSEYGENYKKTKLYRKKGAGANTAVWTAQLPKGRYNVQAWVNSNMYASDAHYTVVHSKGTTQIKRSQLATGGGWSIELGVYEFNGESKVILSDDFSGPETYVVADAIRFTKADPTKIVWMSHSMEEALELSTTMNKPILAYFSTEVSSECQKLESEPFLNPTVVNLSEKYLPVLIRADKTNGSLNTYEVFRVPTIILFTKEGTEITRFSGYKSSTELVKILNAGLSKAK